MRPCRRVAPSSSGWRLPFSPSTYTSGTSRSASTSAPACASTVASAAGPHWYSVCAKNGTAVSSTACVVGGSCGAPAQPATRSAARSALDLVEDINDADELEDQRHDERDADDADQ